MFVKISNEFYDMHAQFVSSNILIITLVS